MKPEIIHSSDFLTDATTLIWQAATAAIAERGQFRIALSGGNTPRPVFENLAEKGASWNHWIFTFGDERCVPPDDEQSNYRMAKESLFDRIDVPRENIHRIRAEEAPEIAAQKYEDSLRRMAGKEPIYRHDLLLLGMGDDGHTASLFPGTEALQEKEKWVVSNFVPKFNTHRITLTYPVLNAARHVCFLVNSKGKDSILEEVFSGTSNYPSAAVQPTAGRLTWLLGA